MPGRRRGGGGRLPVKMLKFRPCEMAFPAILEGNFGNFVMFPWCEIYVIKASNLSFDISVVRMKYFDSESR
jgi:hypothetical protein